MGKLMEHSEQYHEGQEAARLGLNDSDCPYQIGSDEAIDWIDGLASEQLEG